MPVYFGWLIFIQRIDNLYFHLVCQSQEFSAKRISLLWCHPLLHYVKLYKRNRFCWTSSLIKINLLTNEFILFRQLAVTSIWLLCVKLLFKHLSCVLLIRRWCWKWWEHLPRRMQCCQPRSTKWFPCIRYVYISK